MNVETPQPNQCVADRGLFIATFGKCEFEDVAYKLTEASQKNDNRWLTNFTAREFCKLAGWPLSRASDAEYWLNRLAEEGWLDKDTNKERRWFFFSRRVTRFSINEHFANNLYKAQLRNLRMRDPNTPTRQEDVMRALGLIAE